MCGAEMDPKRIVGGSMRVRREKSVAKSVILTNDCR